jgi:hypothetical protein
MKIYQIVSEATSTAKPALVNDAGKWKWKLPDGSMLGGFTDQKAAIDWAKKNPSSLTPAVPTPKQAAQTAWDQTKNAPQPIDPKTGKPMKGLTAPTDLQRAKRRRMTDDDIKKFREKALANKKFRQTAQGKWEGKFGFAVRSALGALQLAGSCIELYTIIAANEEFEKRGMQTPEDSKDIQDFHVRKFVVEVAAQIALWASSVYIARLLVNAVRALMLTVGIATGGAGLAALVASEIFMQAFLAYIKTENGQDAFARYLGGILIEDDSMIGSATGELLNYIGLSTKVSGVK